MKLSSHNSISYLPVKQWWLKPFRFIAQCQDKTLIEQYRLGVRYFDIRIRFNRHNKPIFAHGSVVFEGDVITEFKRLFAYHIFKNNGDKLFIRLILECNKYSPKQEYLFKEFVENIAHNNIDYSIELLGLNGKYDWSHCIIPYYKSDLNPSIYEHYESFNNGKSHTSWWPRLWAALHNEEVLNKGIKEEFLMIDFIDED